MIKSLQMGRGLAALAVVAYHLSSMFGDARHGASPVFSRLTAQGSLGVDFFFVLSGFIIVFAHSRDIGRPEQLGSYLFKRFVRIYPMYWLFTALVILGAVFTGGVSHVPKTLGDIATTISLVRFTHADMPITPAWTLCREILFYTFFAGLILNRIVGAMVLGLWFLAVAATFRYVPHGQWSFTNDVLSAENLSFVFGVTAHRVGKKGLRGGRVDDSNCLWPRPRFMS
jgi:peptidoglycan/LPS O-acetylase OafA/YrhL